MRARDRQRFLAALLAMVVGGLAGAPVLVACLLSDLSFTCDGSTRLPVCEVFVGVRVFWPLGLVLLVRCPPFFPDTAMMMSL